MSNDIDKFINIGIVLETEKYLLEIIKICKKNKIDFIFTIIDQDIELYRIAFYVYQTEIQLNIVKLSDINIFIVSSIKRVT